MRFDFKIRTLKNTRFFQLSYRFHVKFTVQHSFARLLFAALQIGTFVTAPAARFRSVAFFQPWCMISRLLTKPVAKALSKPISLMFFRSPNQSFVCQSFRISYNFSFLNLKRTCISEVLINYLILVNKLKSNRKKQN